MKVIEDFFDATNEGDVDKMLKCYDIEGMNEYYESIDVDQTFTKAELKEYFETIVKAYEEGDMKVEIAGDIYKIESESDLKKAYKKFDEDTDDAEELWEDGQFEDLVEKYDIYAVKLEYENGVIDELVITTLFNEDHEMVNL